MAMVRAALRGVLCGRLSSSSSPFRRLLGSEATAALLPAPLDVRECVNAAALVSDPEQSLKIEADLPYESSSGKVRANDLRRFLEEQREILIELQTQLKDQWMLLRLICGELSFYRSEPVTQEELVVDATRVSCQTNAESIREAACEMCEIKVQKVQCARTALYERTSENGEPGVLSGKFSKNDAFISKKGFDADKFQHPPWPEWELFLDCLRPYASVKDRNPNDGSDELFADTALLKRALVKFAQIHGAAFGTLSRKDLVVLVQHEFPSMDDRTAVGKKRLQNYLGMDESEVTQAKLTDVVRLIYRAVRSVPLLVGSVLPNDLKSAIVHLLQELVSASITKHDSSSATMEGNDQKITKRGEIERLNNMTNMVDGEAVLPTTCPSINQDESTSLTSASLELPKFGSLKERVDARRARLAREHMEKEAAKSLEPSLTKQLEQKTLKACYTQMDKSKESREVVRDFRHFDAIIESEDSDSCERSNSQPKGVSKPSLSSLVPKNRSSRSLQKGAQHQSGQQINHGGGKATGGF